eukprot:TRINITY_DN6680_c0_g1_i1.p1 TRINITY_DN6680_c0_g1~~TRINITY_DN6680_c0_g1_i1.p1  ORF type:complete len:307 (-),score=61.13 TRINITY_DN6680_c0_g1_i1:163-1083(-)
MSSSKTNKKPKKDKTKVKTKKPKKTKDKRKKSKTSTPPLQEAPQDTLTQVIQHIHTAFERPYDKIMLQMAKDVPRYADSLSILLHPDFQSCFQMFESDDHAIVSYQDGFLFLKNNIPFSWSEWYGEGIVGEEDRPVCLVEGGNEMGGKVMDVFLFLSVAMAVAQGSHQDVVELKHQIIQDMNRYFESAMVDQTKRDFQNECFDYIESLGEENDVIKLLRTCTQGHFAPCTIAMMHGFGMADILNNNAHDIIIRFNKEDIEVTHFRKESSHWGSVTWELKTTIDLMQLDTLISVDFNILEIKLYVYF